MPALTFVLEFGCPARLLTFPDCSAWDLLSRKGVICIESSGAAETIDAGVLPTGAFDTVMASPGFSIFARV